jgi:putative transposase
MMARRKAPILPDALLDQLLAGTDARAALDPGGLLDGLKKALTERALNAEMDHHLGSENEAENRRNGYGACPPGDAQRQDRPDRQRQA